MSATGQGTADELMSDCVIIDQEDYQNEDQNQEDGDSQDQYQNHSDNEQHVAGNGANGSGTAGGEEDSDEPEQFRKLFIGGLVSGI